MSDEVVDRLKEVIDRFERRYSANNPSHRVDLYKEISNIIWEHDMKLEEVTA